VWQHWVERWDRMQARYLVRRAQRFELLVRTVRDVCGPVTRVVDLGCGPGSLSLALLEGLPGAEVYGLDFDPAALALARARLTSYNGRARLALADLRCANWVEGIPGPVDAVVSATALHWLEPEELERLYRQIAGLLRPGGAFLNADHVGSAYAPLQAAWTAHRSAMRAAEGAYDADDWDGFWAACLRALGMADGESDGAVETGDRVLGGWEGGVEEGLPLAWHLDVLRRCGFRAVDCFWRCDCDAIYGGII
jgi:SAM-dependent methyltransferase